MRGIVGNMNTEAHDPPCKGNDMADLSHVDVKVKVTFEAVNESPELQNLLRQIIREELANLSPESVEVLTDQIIHQYEVRE